MSVPHEVDLLIVGGGISGAGVALDAVRRGVQRVLLVERGDYADGASSRSSKLVHGGLRYLKQGAWRLTREALHEREQLLRDVPGLVRPMPFLMPHHRGARPGIRVMQAGLIAYDLLAGRRTRQRLGAAQALARMPALRAEGLVGASVYEDATTDDARLTLRVLQEARARGAVGVNYTSLLGLTRDQHGAVSGARLRDADGFEREVATRCVIACAGAWAGLVGARCEQPLPRLRPLRGSHLLLPLARLPLAHAAAFGHPADGRPVFAYPWQGALLVGTTDVDHPDPETAPRIALAEQRYLFDALAHVFPEAALTAADLLATWAGVRPVLHSGESDPSRESREHLVRADRGVVAVAGGKLTTFRPMARAALDAARPWLPVLAAPPDARILGDGPGPHGTLQAEAEQGPPLPGTALPEGTLHVALQHEQVRHLDDLLLRRTRLGLLHPGLQPAAWDVVQRLCAQRLGWDDARWRAEHERYAQLRRDAHGAATP